MSKENVDANTTPTRVTDANLSILQRETKLSTAQFHGHVYW